VRCLRWALGLGACVAAVLLVGAGHSATAGGTGQGKYLTQASKRLAELIGQGNDAGYMLANNKFSVGGGWLKQSKEDWVKLFTIGLEAGKKYRFLAAGDDDALDVDIKISDKDGNVVGKDASTAKTAEVDVKIKKSDRYLVEVRLYKSNKNRPSLTLATVMVAK
jgi:hypothetical protein